MKNDNRISKQKEALALVESGHCDRARPILEELVRSNPDNVDARYLLGVCERSEGDLDLAEATFRHVTSRIPHHHQALYGLGLVLESKGNIPAAIEVWRRVLAINPDFDYATRKLAQYRVSVDQAGRKTPISKHAKIQERQPGTHVPKPQVPPAPIRQVRGKKSRAGCLTRLVSAFLWVIVLGLGALVGGAIGNAALGDGGALIGGILGLILFHVCWIFAVRRRNRSAKQVL